MHHKTKRCVPLFQELQDHETKHPYYSLVIDVLEDELENRHEMSPS